MNFFYCKSEFLGKSAVIKANSKDEAGQKFVGLYSDFLKQLEDCNNKEERIDVDLGIMEITEEITEL